MGEVVILYFLENSKRGLDNNFIFITPTWLQRKCMAETVRNDRNRNWLYRVYPWPNDSKIEKMIMDFIDYRY